MAQNIKFNNMINLKNITFIIPIYYDSEDRKQNLEIIIKWIKYNFETNIYIKEVGNKSYFSYLKNDIDLYEFEFQDNDIIHRTKILNDLTKKTNTPFVCNYDADILLPINQYIESLHRLNSGIDFVYPYTYFYRIPRQNFIELFLNNFNEKTFIEYNKNYNTGESYGGVLFFNKNSFIKAGMENENYISYGPEDWERPIRFNNLGFNIERLDGNLYHIDHWIGDNSSTNNPHFFNNHKEFEKVKQMNKEELQEYIKTWEWCNVNI